VKILSFVEGANPRKGGLGLVGVPMIAKSLADRGHQEVLVIGGRVNPGREPFVQPDIATAAQKKNGPGSFGIVTFPAWSKWAFAPAILWRLCRYARDADFIILHSLYSFPVLAGYLLDRLYRKPYGLWPHGVLLPVQRRISIGKKRIYDWLVARRILSQASALFFAALGEREEAYKLGLTPPSVVIPHGFDAREFERLPPRGQFRAKYLDGQQGPLVLYLSRLNAKKGLDLLAKAFALVADQVPDARLAIVGRGDPVSFEAEVKNWVHKFGLEDRTIMPGLLTGQERLVAFADADIFVFPSVAENFGFAMFEAMASHLPVVVSDTLDYAAQVQHYEAGLVVRRDPQEFANAILKLLRDSDLRKRMGENGLRLARAYSWEACGEKVERTIQCILQGKPLPADLTLEKQTATC
jgi:glycosyltransferase involved in cell wall biosynthesis